MLEKSILSAFACDTCVSPVFVLFVVVGNISWSAIAQALLPVSALHHYTGRI
ncbi:MAG: hypothetical protein ACYTXF_30580 [Nostoc sp.]